MTVDRAFLVPLALFGLAMVFRATDIFILRLDELWGEIILSKLLGLALLLAYLRLAGHSVREIGLHRQGLGRSCLIATVGMGLALTLGYGAVLAMLRQGGQEAGLILTAVDPKSGLQGGVLFAGWLMLGNTVNSLMEEGLFRGVMLRHFRARLSPWPSLLLGAALFAAWHLVWPIKHAVTGQGAFDDVATEALMLMLGSFAVGVVYGYLFMKTDSLWAPCLAHFLNNAVFNVLFIGAHSELRPPSEFPIFGPVYLLAVILLIPWTWFLARRLGLPEMRPWPQPR